MRAAEGDPQVVATLDAIDATLAGEPVDPVFAEIAELALLLQAERPAADAEVVRALDERVERLLRPPARAPRDQRATWRRWWALAPAAGLAAAGVVAVVVVLGSAGGGASSSASPGSAAHGGGASSSASLGSAAHGTKVLPKAPAPSHSSHPALLPAQRGTTYGPAAGPNIPVPSLRVPDNGRKQVQSAQLILGVAPKRIDTVAQEVFDVVGTQNGFVQSSQVTAGGSGGYAHFQLEMPTFSLPQTMSELSRLHYASVLSRTDTVEDVTSQYRKALRHHDKRELRKLQHQIAYSQVTVTIQAYVPPPPHHRAKQHPGFTIPRAAHTALHVLEVVAGVSLIALAVIVPLGLVAALGWWIIAALRRRRREQALDAA